MHRFSTRFPDLIRLLVWLFGVAVASAHAASQGAEFVDEWQARGDAAVAAADWRAAQEAYGRSLAQSLEAGDESARTIVRQKLGLVLLELAERESALHQFESNLRYYRRLGDGQSASFTAFLAAQILLDLDRFEDVLRVVADYSREADPDVTRRAMMEHFRVLAYERAGNNELARRVVLESRKAIPTEVWNRFLREDAIRIGEWQTAAAPPRWLLWIGVALLASIVASASVWRSRRAEIILLGIACIVTLTAAELVLRVIMPSSAGVRHILHPPNQSTTFHPESGVMPGVDYRESHFTTNSIGLRGTEIPRAGTVRVLAIGGSSTEALYLDDQDAWTAVLERELRERHGLRVWVGNAGKSGLTSFSHVSQVRAYTEEIQPSLIIMQAGFNDMSLCISGGRKDVRDNALRFRWPDYQDTYGNFVFQEIRAPQAHSTLRLEELIDRAYARWAAPSAAPPTPERKYVVQDHGGNFYQEQRRRRHVAAQVHVAPDVTDCIGAYQENLRRIAGLASAHGARLVLLTQGAMYRPDLKPEEERLLWFGSVNQSFFGAEPPSRYYSAAVMAEILQRYNASTMSICEEMKLTCVDVNGFLPRSAAMYYDDAHMNIQGSRALGVELARRFVRDNVLE